MRDGAKTLPFWVTFRNAHRVLGAHRSDIVRYSAPWFAGLIAVSALAEWIHFPHARDVEAGFSWHDFIYAAATILPFALVGAVVGVFVHRRVLLADRPQDPKDTSHQTARVNSYFWRYMALGGLFVASIVLLAIPAVSATAVLDAQIANFFTIESARYVAWLMPALLLFPLACYMPVRFTLSLPATAIDSPRPTFWDSWAATRGHFWKLFWGGALSYWPSLPFLPLTLLWLDSETMSRRDAVLLNVAETATFCVSWVISAAFFSLAYRHLTGEPQPER